MLFLQEKKQHKIFPLKINANRRKKSKQKFLLKINENQNPENFWEIEIWRHHMTIISELQEGLEGVGSLDPHVDLGRGAVNAPPREIAAGSKREEALIPRVARQVREADRDLNLGRLLAPAGPGAPAYPELRRVGSRSFRPYQLAVPKELGHGLHTRLYGSWVRPRAQLMRTTFRFSATV